MQKINAPANRLSGVALPFIVAIVFSLFAFVEPATGQDSTKPVLGSGGKVRTLRSPGIPELMYYKFNGTGTTVPNLALNPVGTQPALISGGITQGGTGQFGGGLIGTNAPSSTDFLNTGWAPNLGGQSWTISLYLNGNFGNGLLYYFFGDINSTAFRCFTNGVALPNNLMLRGAGLADTTATGGATSNVPTVTHFVYDSVAGETRAYVNGVLVATVAQPTPPNLTGAGPFKVMGYSSNLGSPVGGVIDEFRFYNRALDAAEIAATWNVDLSAPTAAGVVVSGRAISLTGRGIGNVEVSLTGANGDEQISRTNAFGYFIFEDVTVGNSYVISARRKGLVFPSRVVTVTDEVRDLEIAAVE